MEGVPQTKFQRYYEKKKSDPAWVAKQAAHAKKWREKRRQGSPELHRASIRRKALKKRYGISVEQFDALIVEQDGICAVCRRPFGLEKDSRACVDHDHDTREVLALLCDRCNRMIAGDDPRLLEAGAHYLRHHGK